MTGSPTAPPIRNPMLDASADTDDARVADIADAAAAFSSGDIARALTHCGEVLNADPNHAPALHLSAFCYLQNNNYDRALSTFAKAISLDPENAAYLNSYGLALVQTGQHQDAVEVFDQALQIDPSLTSAWSNKAVALMELRRTHDARQALEEALILEPNDATALINLGSVWTKLGRIEEAIAVTDKVLAIQPASVTAVRNQLANMYYDLNSDPKDILRQAQSLWDIAGPLPQNELHAGHVPNAELADKQPLTVGYVSGDFNEHPVGRLLEPVVARHDPQSIRTVMYANSTKQDDVTKLLKNHSSAWRSIATMSDADVASQIRNDNVDILVDLSGLTQGDRLQIFRRKPAPIQMTWLGYPGTTGLSEIDYIVADRGVIRVDEESLYSEIPLYLPNTLLCFHGRAGLAASKEPPGQTVGHITFGSFNNPSKVNAHVAKAWARIVEAVPNSRLLIKYHNLTSQFAVDTVIRQFAEHGFDPSRLDVLGNTSSDVHYRAYDRVDIALDPFPYNGTMTTLDALWMGVPVVCVDGSRWSSRMTAGILKSIGLNQLIAGNEDSYIERAVDLAQRPDEVAALRRSLRIMVESSPLYDAARFTRSLEALYREAWKKWCRD